MIIVWSDSEYEPLIYFVNVDSAPWFDVRESFLRVLKMTGEVLAICEGSVSVIDRYGLKNEKVLSPAEWFRHHAHKLWPFVGTRDLRIVDPIQYHGSALSRTYSGEYETRGKSWPKNHNFAIWFAEIADSTLQEISEPQSSEDLALLEVAARLQEMK